MAQFEKHFVQDLTQDIKIRQCGTIVFNGDNLSNVITVDLYNGTEPYSGGGSVSCSVICPDGATVPITNGSISGNTVSVTLTGDCFALPGQIGVGVQVVSGDIRTTILKAIYNVELLETDTIVDPGSRITASVGQLVSDIENAVAQIPASDMASLMAGIAPTFSASTNYPAGAYVYYSGILYRFTTAHAAGSWTGTDATAVALGNDVADLKSTFERDGIKTGIIERDFSGTVSGKSFTANIPYNGTSGEKFVCKPLSVSPDSVNKVVIYLMRSNNTYQTAGECAVGGTVSVTANADFVTIRYYVLFTASLSGSVSLSTETIFENNVVDVSEQNTSEITAIKNKLDYFGAEYSNIAYGNGVAMNEEYTAAAANESYNGSKIPYSFVKDKYYLVMYKLNITGYLNTSAGLVRPTLIGYDGALRRCEYTQDTPNSWLYPANYTLGNDIILWDVVKSPYTSSNYLIALHCPSSSSPFNNATTKITYKSVAVIAVANINTGVSLAGKLINGFTYQADYFVPFLSEQTAEQISNSYESQNGFNAFSRFCVVGDSLSVGYYTDSSNVAHNTDYAHSWPYFVEKETGAKAYWAGYAGATCASWLAQSTGDWGLTYTQNLGTMPLYFLCMGANEYGTTIGTISDIDDENPTTLYGYIGKTIRELREISTDCFIVCVGTSRQSSNASVVNAVYEAICKSGSFDKCYYYDVQYILGTQQFSECFYASHYSALGYQRMARLYNWVLNQVMSANVSDFLYINEADVGEQPKE